MHSASVRLAAAKEYKHPAHQGTYGDHLSERLCPVLSHLRKHKKMCELFFFSNKSLLPTEKEKIACRRPKPSLPPHPQLYPLLPPSYILTVEYQIYFFLLLVIKWVLNTDYPIQGTTPDKKSDKL